MKNIFSLLLLLYYISLYKIMSTEIIELLNNINNNLRVRKKDHSIIPIEENKWLNPPFK